jgi:crotonobetainyl-CoA:carnitine CoA-transferase CaiB-like acyl-CoA transferase
VSIAAGLNGGEKMGAPRPGMGVYEIGGRHLALQVVGSTDLWPRLLALMKRPELAQDPRFATPVARRENWPLLRDLIGQWLTRFRTVDEALAALGAARIPCAPVLEPHEVIAHPHLLERGAFPEVPHPTRGHVRVTASPYHWDGKPVHPAGGAPYRVGEHSRLVLSGLLGYDAKRIDALIAAGAVEAP